jgi:hypothetical protein
MMDENFIKLQAAAWVPSSALPNDVAMPANTPLTFALHDKYDAFKMSSTTSASGTETAYAGMAAYRLKIPANAISGSRFIKGLTVTLGADKFAYSGIKVAVHATDDTTPATTWAILRTGAIGSTVDTSKEFATYDADPEVSGVLDAPEASVSSATNKAQSFVFDLSAIAMNYAYLWIYISMYNYTDYRANRPYWVEGSGIVNGATAVVEFASSVTADADIAWSGETQADGRCYRVGTTTGNPYLGRYDQANRITVTDSDTLVVKSSKMQMDLFPASGSTSAIAFDYADTTAGNAGSGTGTVGLTSSTVVAGYIMARYVFMPSGSTFSKFRFQGVGGANIISLAAKQFEVSMNVWESNIVVPFAYDGGTLQYSMDEVLEFEFHTASYTAAASLTRPSSPVWFSGSAASSLSLKRHTLSDMTLSMTHLKMVSIRSTDVTPSTWFDLPLSGAGTIKMLLFAFKPTKYWGSVGSATNAAISPGTYIYLK